MLRTIRPQILQKPQTDRARLSEVDMIIREYRPEDCKEIEKLFYDTVHTVNARDYTEAQLAVWATGTVDSEGWDRSFREHYTLVALDDKLIIGFGDIDKSGYLDRLYVHKDYQRKGVAAAICDRLEAVEAETIITHASITARPFFEKRGYTVVREQQVERQGVILKNYVMKKEKPAEAANRMNTWEQAQSGGPNDENNALKITK